jgi:high-affinity iron transporter
MLATLVIGLREGLEAALIVGIIAAFLRKNGKSLVPVWIGVGLAVALSIAVGVALDLVEQALPQARQEGMEAAIGSLAVVFVTGMILWMNQHAASMKRSLEQDAAQALHQGSAYALAGMAFLAVLREGFETSVFLLATFSAAQSATLAATGAVIGLLLAVAIGWGIYAGGVRINLGRFFRITGLFLILVAAGLVITSLRAAHEAGWLNAGQQPTIDLAWLVAPGTIQSALITGVLGIPADPRRIEVIGWLAYLIPVTLSVLRPATPRDIARRRLTAAVSLAIAALGLATLYPSPRLRLPPRVPLVGGTAELSNSPAALTVTLDGRPPETLPLPGKSGQTADYNGIDALLWRFSHEATPSGAPATLTLDQVLTLAGGRLPIGFNAARNPGPFAATWSVTRSTQVWTADGLLLDAATHGTALVTLSGGGLRTPRTLTIEDPSVIPVQTWHVLPAYRDQAIAALNTLAAARAERQFWAAQLPVVLLVVAIFLATLGGRTLIRRRRDAKAPALSGATHAPR